MRASSQMVRFTAALPLLLSSPIWGAGAPPSSSVVRTEAAAPRQVTDLSPGWHFRFGVAGDAPATPGYDDSGWETVAVPHTWNRIGEYATTRSAATNNAQGIGWYRLTVDAPAAASGQRHYLDFAAVSNIADVWVNGSHVGQHRGAFSRFRFDVTKLWKPGAANLVVVKADNSKREPGSSTSQTIPLAGDFFVSGGIYRGVSLVTANSAGIDLLDHGGPGVYARATGIMADKADVSILTRLRNSGAAPRRLQLTTIVRDASGAQVAQAVQPVALKVGQGEARANVAIARPHLWNGRADPYLYSVTVEVREKGGLIDSMVQPLGLRTFRFDANDGYFLNGQPLQLHGVSRHQDRMGKGWALSPADHAEDMALIADMGANTVRQAHYQHADEWTTQADKAGMVVWAEVPYVTAPTLTGGEGSPELWANAEEQAREQIRQAYNHPSIMMWSVGNEVDSAKGFGIGGKNEPPRPLKLLQRLNQVAKEEDPSRPTTFADCCEDLGLIKTAGEKLAGTADLIGYNRYYGWYYPQPFKAQEQLGAEMDKFHAKHPALPLSISEYGAGGAVSQHSDDIFAGFVNFIGRPHPEEFQAWVLEQNWAAIRTRKYIFASWVWNMFDFASDMRDEGDAVDLNDKGLVTFDRKVKKDAYYYFQSQWSDRPMIHLTGKGYAARAYPAMTVKAYSNADRASLSVNGKPLGEVACSGGICLWPDVALASGANDAVVTALAKGQAVTDSANWSGPDPAQGIRIEAGDPAGHVVGGRRFGSDAFVTGGKPVVLNMGGFGGRRMAAPRSVSAPEPDLYDYWREGETFSYAIPVAKGKWTVTIHTFEPRLPAAVHPLMTVKANGKLVIPAFNVRDAAGGPLKGISRSFPVKVTDGTLHLDFAATDGQAVVAAIEVSR
ncbi:MAG TPA: glycoside hydrolase family 2 TIM barrel-domain containing protein [Sphingobium sp.]